MSGGALIQSDARGTFSLWVEPGDVHATAWAPRHSSGSAKATAPGGELDLVIAKEAVLVGRVALRGSGTPVAGAEVRASSDSAGKDSLAYTDKRGRFRIEGLAVGTYRPTARTADATGLATASIELGVGKTSSTISIDLVPIAAVAPSPAPAIEEAAAPETDADVKRRLARAIKRTCGGEGITVDVEFAVVVGGEVSSPSVRPATKGGTVPTVVRQLRRRGREEDRVPAREVPRARGASEPVIGSGRSPHCRTERSTPATSRPA